MLFKTKAKIVITSTFAVAVVIGGAWAQQNLPAKPSTSLEQALSNKLLNALNDGIRCDTEKIDKERELAQMAAQIKDMHIEIATLKASKPVTEPPAH
jgi:hypothetical protein